MTNLKKTSLIIGLAAGTLFGSVAVANRSTVEAGHRFSESSSVNSRHFNPLLPTRAKQRGKSSKRLFTPVQNPFRKTVSKTGARRVNDATTLKPSEGLSLRGSVISTWSFVNSPGLYYVPYTSDEEFVPIEGAAVVAEYGAYDDGQGRYYVAWLEDWGMISFPHLTVYSTDSWEEIDWPECEHSILCTDNATDPTTGDVYGCYYNYNDNDELVLAWAKADYKLGSSEALRVLGENEQVYGVACNADGQYYCILGDGSLMKVDKANGNFTKIGDTGLRPYYSTSATFDDKSGNIIFSYAPATGKSSLWIIDPATAAASLLVEYVENEQITALEVVKPEADDLAPAIPELIAEIPNGGMELNYTIKMPTTLFNGDAATGSLHWVVSLNGIEKESGESTFGGTVSGSLTLENEGAHLLTAYVTNEAGRSPVAKMTLINGTGTPMAPEGFRVFNFGGGEISLFWEEVTASADGAYIDPEAITYTVKRNGETVAENLTDTWFDDKVTIPDTFVKLTYEVTAHYEDNTSEPATGSTGIGSITPPYSSRLDASQADTDSGLYSFLDENGDNSTWWFSPSYGSFIYDYNNENAGDDWLFSPAFHLEAGKKYELSYSVSGNSTLYTERYAVAMGLAPTAQAMRTELLPATEISTERYEPIGMTLTIEPATDDNYYIGWHALSDAGMFQIHIRDITLSAPLTATSPAEVKDIVLERDKDGYLKMTGSFTAPSVDISGNALKSIGKITVSREGKEETLATFNNPQPGAALKFEDNDLPASGTYTYAITSEGVDGAPGRAVKASLFVGPYAPENVPAVNMVEESTPGKVKLSWDAPINDVSGHPLKDENLSYMVYVAGEYGMAEPILEQPVTQRSLSIEVCKPEEMDFAVFFVSALNMGVESENLTRSPMIPVGKAETLPYLHSFTESDLEAHLLGYVSQSGTYGSISLGTPEYDKIPSADGDDAFLVATQYEPGATLDFFTGKIDLTGTEHPALTLRHYKWSDTDANKFSIYAILADGKTVDLGTTDHSAGGNIGWNVTVCPLEKVKGQVVELAVSALFMTHTSMPFDALRIAEMPEHDLSATFVSVPGRIEPGKEFVATGAVCNMGSKKAETYNVELLINDEAVASIEGKAVESGETLPVQLRHTLSPLASGTQKIQLRVNMDSDSDATNDVSPAVTPTLVESAFPAVADLKATATPEGVELSWTEPSTGGYGVKEAEDFEDAEAWTGEVDGWTMVDVDDQQIGTLEGASMPDAVAMRTHHSFFVFDSSSDDITYYNPALEYLVKGNSGSKSLVAIYILNPSVAQDDWAISPLLSGEAQTISFYARSFHPEYLDHMEVLYSMKDSTDPADFVSLCENGPFEVPQLVDAIGNAVYQQYQFKLPQGAKRFALRVYNEGGNGFMLMIDDIKFDQANKELAVDHYDVYRNGICINPSPVIEAAYLDASVPAGTHTYNVVTIYNRGISGASNSAVLTTSGIDDILASGVEVSVEGNEIVVANCPDAFPVMLSDTDGRRLHSGFGNCHIPADTGIYLLTIGDKSIKLMVK